MRTCAKCGQEKSLDLFVRDSRRPDGLRTTCKACQVARYREWVARDPERAAEMRRLAVRKYRTSGHRKLKKYGLTERQYEDLVTKQGGKCLICNRAEQLCIDHDHVSGVVRGLLCHDCNLGIGKLKDDPEVIFRAAAYVATARA